MVFSKRKWFVAILVVVVTLTAAVGAAGAADKTEQMLSRIKTVYTVVSSWHKDGADIDKFTAGAIKGGLEALGDPYTNYYSAEEYTDFIDSLNGSFSGIGAYLEVDGPYIVISSPIKGSPAAAAGLESGDRILEVDGRSMVGSSTEMAVKLIRGVAGTGVTLKIERPSEKRVFEVTIVRATISIPEVESKILSDGVGYIQLASFGDDAVRDFYKAVESLKRQGAKGLVLDLRQNGGGYLDAAVDIASAFVPKDEPVVWEVGSDDKTALKSTGRLINLPTVVLVDNGSASASEILAGALQDYAAAPLVGTKTFGKGTVQQILNLSAGGGMKVTVAEYLTPKERHVHGIGLTPDYLVQNAKPDPERTAPLEFQRVLTTTDAGLDVLYLQYRLQDLGYDVETRGHFGRKTTEAVRLFAEANGLGNEPAVTEKVVEALNAKVAALHKQVQQEDLQLAKAVEVLKGLMKP